MKSRCFVIKFLVCCALLLSVMGAWAGASKASASDIEQHWAKETIISLMEQGIINGYADGTFRPDHNINRDEYIKLVVVALGHPLENGSPYWAQPYLDKAQELGIVNEGEFMEYNVPANREEMASIITRAAALSETAPEYEYDYTIPEHISDYEQISPKYQGIVVNSYRYGLITGKQVGVFAPTDNSTRAEAATVIARLLDPEKRNTYQSYVENHLALKTASVSDIDDIAILDAFYNKFEDTRNMGKYSSVEELRGVILEVRALARNIKYKRVEDIVNVTLPEHDKNKYLMTLNIRSGQKYDPNIYTIDLNEPKPDGKPMIFSITVSDNQRGSVILHTSSAYLDNNILSYGVGNAHYDEAFGGGYLERVAIY